MCSQNALHERPWSEAPQLVWERTVVDASGSAAPGVGRRPPGRAVRPGRRLPAVNAAAVKASRRWASKSSSRCGSSRLAPSVPARFGLRRRERRRWRCRPGRAVPVSDRPAAAFAGRRHAAAGCRSPVAASRWHREGRRPEGAVALGGEPDVEEGTLRNGEPPLRVEPGEGQARCRGRRCGRAGVQRSEALCRRRCRCAALAQEVSVQPQRVELGCGRGGAPEGPSGDGARRRRCDGTDGRRPMGGTQRARRPGAAEAPVRSSRWCGAWHAGRRDGVRIGPTWVRGQVTRKGVGRLLLRSVRGGLEPAQVGDCPPGVSARSATHR